MTDKVWLILSGFGRATRPSVLATGGWLLPNLHAEDHRHLSTCCRCRDNYPIRCGSNATCESVRRGTPEDLAIIFEIMAGPHRTSRAGLVFRHRINALDRGSVEVKPAGG